MPGNIFASSSLDELIRELRRSSVAPGLAPRIARRTPDPATFSDRLGERAGTLSDTGNEQLLAGIVRRSSPPTQERNRRTAAVALPLGIVLNLVFVGLVATATIGVFFGVGFYLLAHPATEMSAGFGIDRVTRANPLHREIFPRPYSHPPSADRETASVKGKTEMSRPAESLALVALTQHPTADEAVRPEKGDVTGASVPHSPDGEASASAATQPSAMEAQEDAAPRSRVEAIPESHVALILQHDVPARAGIAVLETGIVVAQWGFGYSLENAQKQVPQANVVHGRPLYLLITLNGMQAAVDRMRADRRLAIEVHWVRESVSGPAGVANLVTDLTIGRPGFADAFEEQVRRRGFFEWHSWARKDALSPGMWTVSLTSSDGQLLLCGQDAQPCRFTINVG